MAIKDQLAIFSSEAADCKICRLCNSRTQVVFGDGNPDAGLMIVGEAPGRDEDLQGVPFVGRSGKLLATLLDQELGIDRSGYYITNVVKCRPPDNRDPLPQEVEACNPYLESQLELIRPKVILTLGNFASKLLVGSKEGITKLRAHEYPSKFGWIVPTFHPSAALRGGGQVVAQMRADLIRVKKLMAAEPASA